MAATVFCFCVLAAATARAGTSDSAAGPDKNYLLNGRLSEIDGKRPRAWTLRRGEFAYDSRQGVATLTSSTVSGGVGLAQEVSLAPGHYLLRGVVRANTIEAILAASSLDYRGTADRMEKVAGPFGIPIGVSNDFHTVELPFFVEDDGGAERKVTVAVQHQYSAYVRHKIEIRELALVRLGPTELKAGWAAKVPVQPFHGLATLREASQWDRPGRAIFTDTCTGAEVWLMTQGERSHLRAQGINNFSPDGKYLYVNVPGVILRTDGTARYEGFRRESNKPEPWMARWMERRLPAGSDPSDWVEAAIPGKEAVVLRNLVTGQELKIPLPKRPGWQLHLLPGKIWGQNLREMQHDTVVWLADDERRIGLSAIDGSDFRAFDVKSMSANKAKDVFLWKPFWTRGLDGAWYVAYILNWVPIMGASRPTAENTVNPGQIWALPIDKADRRGLLRVVDGHQYWAMCMKPYVLEDGTIIHFWTATHRAMNTQAGYRVRGGGYSTLALEAIDTGQVRHFIGSYPCLDHVDFNHPEFIFPESTQPPYALLMIDVARRAMWPVTVLDFHNYGEYSQHGAGFLGQNPSPGATKLAYVSSMLCKTPVVAGVRPKTAVDVYVAVIRYPEPPQRLRRDGNRLVWQRPPSDKEIRGYNVYRSAQSGVGYSKLTPQPVAELSYRLPSKGAKGHYAVTSVEHSGLESRRFSNEVSVDGEFKVRLFYEAELARLDQPMAPVFDPRGAGNGYAVAVTDPDLLYRGRLAAGLQGVGALPIDIPREGTYKLMGRVRALKEGKQGRIDLRISGSPAGQFTVGGPAWHWVGLDSPAIRLPAGPAEIRFATGAVGIALDTILLTNDLAFQAAGKGSAPDRPPTTPGDLRIENPVAPRAKPATAPPEVLLSWRPSTAPQGVRYYNIHRSATPDFVATQATLLASVDQPPFADCGLGPRPYYYRVVAVDAWGNVSPPSDPIAVSFKTPE